MRKEQIRAFRRNLREFERLMSECYDSSCAHTGLSLAQCHHLLGIEEEQPTNGSDLSDRLNLDRSTVSRTVETLVRRGLVTRTKDHRDRRISVLVLSQRGMSAAERIHEENDQYFVRVFSAIPRQHRNAVLHAFGLLVNACRRV
jgi:DNA-binding MarR family transcriptional regulator